MFGIFLKFFDFFYFAHLWSIFTDGRSQLLTNLCFPHFLHNFLNLYHRRFAIMISILFTFWLLNNTSTICRRPYFYCLKRKSRYCKSNVNRARSLIILHRYASYPMNTRMRKKKPKPTLTNFSIK